jgi:hypothetical protein
VVPDVISTLGASFGRDRACCLLALVGMPTLSDPIPVHLSCPSCHASRIATCGELLLGQPCLQLLVACLECERVFTCTKLTPKSPVRWDANRLTPSCRHASRLLSCGASLSSCTRVHGVLERYGSPAVGPQRAPSDGCWTRLQGPSSRLRLVRKLSVILEPAVGLEPTTC